MNRTREVYNAKARRSVAGTRKKGKLKRKHTGGEEQVQIEAPNSNALIHEGKPKEVKELERKDRLKQELIAQSQSSKWTNKKSRRLEKYIDKKLKKEERVHLLEKLAQSQNEISSSLNLHSSATLGTGRPSTHKERRERYEDREIRNTVDGISGKRRRDVFSIIGIDVNDSSDSDIERKGESRTESLNSTVTQNLSLSTHQNSFDTTPSSNPISIGSALQRNPDGTVVAPRIQPRRGKQISFAGWGRDSRKVYERVDESNTSFDSSDSAYDAQPEDGENASDSKGEDSDSGGCTDDSQDFQRDTNSQDDGIKGVSSPQGQPKKRSIGFKDWALKQLSMTKGYVPPVVGRDEQLDVVMGVETSTSKPEQCELPPAKKRKVSQMKPTELRGPLGEDLQLPSTSFALQFTSQRKGEFAPSNRTKAISVTRPPEVEEARMMLPIVAEEQPIMEAVLLNPVVIICGETGSGKTTQVPQFLYENGFGLPDSDNPGIIGITQPRRVAAVSMAARVAHELSLASSKVSYQIRYDATISPSTSIKFMTDGVLLRELATDFLLSRYSVIIIDEAHERSMNTDILIGVLSRVMKLREEMWKTGKDNIKPLRLIIMSATLRVSDFAENKTLFPTPPPVINVAARQHPVTIHFSRKTAQDYVTEVIKKATKIHTRLPPGGILIFLTGQNEITGVCRKLEAHFGAKFLQERLKKRAITSKRIRDAALGLEEEQRQHAAPAQAVVEAEDVDLGEERADALAPDADEGVDADIDQDALDTDDEDENEEIEADGLDATPMHIVPLYSLLESEKQMRVFKPPPEGHRLVVVSTNVAETSLTIPGIRYVIDCGRAKERRYDLATGVQTFQISWISKASAAQRAGRAGRTGPGHCYRLYSSALYENHFDNFAKPEILRVPIDSVVLQMKAMHIDAVTNFPFPTPPDRFAIHKAERMLTHLGALKAGSTLDAGAVTGSQITDLGKTMSLFPFSPRYSRMLVAGHQHGCLPYVVAIVSALSVGDPFLYDESLFGVPDAAASDGSGADDINLAMLNAKEAHRMRKKAFFKSHQIHSSLGKGTSDIIKLLSVVGAYSYAGGGRKFCEEHFVRGKAMEEIHKLRAQISNIVHINFPGVDAGYIPKLKPPNDLQIKVLRQLLTAGFIDQVAIRKDRINQTSVTGNQYSTSKGVPYRAIGVDEDVFIHPSSVLANVSPPEYVAFHEIVRTSKVWVKGLTIVNSAWLASLGKGSMCTFSRPIKNNLGISMVIPRFGPHGWELPAIKADILY